MLGKNGEDIAARFLENDNYRIIERNFRTRIGEIDIIAGEEATLVFCEVKTRKSLRYGHPIEAVTPRKQQTIRTLAEQYLTKPHIRSRFNTVRFDVIAIETNGNDYSVEHIKNAF